MFKGSLDEFAFYDRAMDIEEIHKNFIDGRNFSDRGFFVGAFVPEPTTAMMVGASLVLFSFQMRRNRRLGE